MSEQVLYKNLMSFGFGIEACIEKKVTPPAMILLYSAIDTAGWLDSERRVATRDSFTSWADRYLLISKSLQCSSIDLYAARCGLLHTFTADSKLSFEGKARRILYAWGTAKAEDLQRTIALSNNSSKYVAVHVEELYEAWRLGLLAFINDLDKDSTRRSKVYAKAQRFFSELSMETVEDILSVLDQSGNSV